MKRFEANLIGLSAISIVLLLPFSTLAQRSGRIADGLRPGKLDFGMPISHGGGFVGGFPTHDTFRQGMTEGNVPGGLFFPLSSGFYPFYAFGGIADVDSLPDYGRWPYYGYPHYDVYPEYPQTLVIITDTVDKTTEQPRQQAVTEPARNEPFWWIALRGNQILAVSDYWLAGNTLHYIVYHGKEFSVDYSQVDLDHTKRLNYGRATEFAEPRKITESKLGNPSPN